MTFTGTGSCFTLTEARQHHVMGFILENGRPFSCRFSSILSKLIAMPPLPSFSPVYHYDMITKARLHFSVCGIVHGACLKFKCHSFESRIQVSTLLPPKAASCTCLVL
jgi:hypothetical protein